MAETTSGLDARVAEMEARLRDLEERERGMRTVRSFLREVLPTEVRGHLRAARKEQLLAARSFIDHWIAKAEREDSTERREKIIVE